MKKIKKIYVMLLGVSLFFANTKTKDHQETPAEKEDNQTKVKKYSLPRYTPFVAAGVVLLIAAPFIGKYFSDSSSHDSPPPQQTITNQDAQSFLKEIRQIPSQAKGEAARQLNQQLMQELYKKTTRTKLKEALEKWESSDEVDQCLQQFIKQMFSASLFKPLAEKHPAIVAELQKGNFPSILTENDHPLLPSTQITRANYEAGNISLKQTIITKLYTLILQTDAEARSSLEEIWQILRQPQDQEAIDQDREEMQKLYHSQGLTPTKLKKALKKWESTDVIDPCLQPFIAKTFSNPLFESFAKKHPAIAAELQKGNFPSILTENDHSPLFYGQVTKENYDAGNVSLKQFLIKNLFKLVHIMEQEQ